MRSKHTVSGSLTRMVSILILNLVALVRPSGSHFALVNVTFKQASCLQSLSAHCKNTANKMTQRNGVKVHRGDIIRTNEGEACSWTANCQT